jgi:hypothetical protein
MRFPINVLFLRCQPKLIWLQLNPANADGQLRTARQLALAASGGIALAKLAKREKHNATGS